MEDRDSRGRFLPGNPGGGRKKKDPTTKDLLQALTPEAVTRLGDLIHSDDEDIAFKASAVIIQLSMNGKKCNEDRILQSKDNVMENLDELQQFFAQFGLQFTFSISPF